LIQPDINILHLRHILAQTMRDFFLKQDFWEVDTPTRIPAPAPELHIQAIPCDDAFLRTSPELHMKRMLAAGAKAIFQLGPCFRMHEHGARHRPEFMMLEWYRIDADYMDILKDMQQLLVAVHNAVHHHPPAKAVCNPNHTWNICTVSDTYQQHANWNPIEDFDANQFDLDMVNIIEPSFPKDRYTILMDYPVPVAALSRCKPQNPTVAERWELYAGDLEIANAFSELNDPKEQRERFNHAIEKKRAIGEPIAPLDEAFLSALEHGMPPCAGVALGFDRLLMALTGSRDISQVIPFP
jgi:lysyl-tRNA synthetase class 2